MHQAASNPDVGIIGAEPYINGVATLLGKIRKAGVSRVALVTVPAQIIHESDR